MKKRVIAAFTMLFAFTSIFSGFPKPDISAASLKIRYGQDTIQGNSLTLHTLKKEFRPKHRVFR